MGKENTLKKLLLSLLLVGCLTAIAGAQVVGGLSTPTFSNSVGSSFNTLGNFRSYSHGLSAGSYGRSQGASSVMQGGSSMPGAASVSTYSNRQRIGQRINNRLNSRIRGQQTQRMLSQSSQSGFNRQGSPTRIAQIRPISTRYNPFTSTQEELFNPTATSGFRGSYVSRAKSAMARDSLGSRRSSFTTGTGLSNSRGLSSTPSWLTTN